MDGPVTSKALARWGGFVLLEVVAAVVFGIFTAVAAAALLLLFGYSDNERFISWRQAKRIALQHLYILAWLFLVVGTSVDLYRSPKFAAWWSRDPSFLAKTFTFVRPKMITTSVSAGQGRVTAVAIVDASQTVGEIRDKYRLVLVARVADASIDKIQDTRIAKSNVFRIPERTVEISVDASQPPVKEMRSGETMHFMLMCVPAEVGREFKTVAEALRFSGAICDEKGVGMTVAVQPRP